MCSGIVLVSVEDDGGTFTGSTLRMEEQVCIGHFDDESVGELCWEEYKLRRRVSRGMLPVPVRDGTMALAGSALEVKMKVCVRELELQAKQQASM